MSATTVAAAGMGLLMGFGIVKATLDPAAANTWLYYTPAEREAVAAFWRLSDGQVAWTGPDDRLVYVSATWFPSGAHDNAVEGFSPTDAARDYVISPTVTASAAAQGKPAPWRALSGANRVYDDGGAQIYRLAPDNAFQQ